jgi:Protein of unknown function (DUF1232)
MKPPAPRLPVMDPLASAKPPFFKVLAALLGLVLSGIYLLNPTAGLFEFLPDNLPFVGNLDEGAASVLFLWALATLRDWFTRR